MRSLHTRNLITNILQQACVCLSCSADRRPYVTRPTLEVIRKPGKRSVVGVAMCCSRIYVIESRSDAVLAYQSTAPYDGVQFSIDKMKNLADIVSFDEHRCLYVACPRVNCGVWRVAVADDCSAHSGEKFIDAVEAWSLFVDRVRQQLVVTTPGAVCVYGVDGIRRKRIALARHIDALHAVVTPNDGRILVSHTGRDNDSNFHQVNDVFI